jgi:TPR repeat protein
MRVRRLKPLRPPVIALILAFSVLSVQEAAADRDRGVAACEAQDWETAARELAPEEATTTDPEVVHCLADMHFSGFGLPRDSLKAFSLWKRIADLGNDDAEETVGFFYLDGEGTARDTKLAEEYFLRSAKQGNPKAMSDLSLYYWLGFIGCCPDRQKSLYWTAKLADFGDVAAAMELARIYASGDSVAKDEKTALAWALKAAKQDSVEAYLFLGNALERGQGAEKDPVEAYKWFNLAAFHRESPKAAEAARRRDTIAAGLTPDQIRQAQHLAFEWRLTARPQ